MEITTTRFGTVTIEAEDLLVFPHGLIGYEDCRHWVLLADADNDAFGWLQCVGQADLALPVVSPRRFVDQYRIRVARQQLAALELAQLDRAYVLVVVSKHQQRLTLNLKAPIIINLDRRTGCQAVTTDEQPVQMELTAWPTPLRKSA